MACPHLAQGVIFTQPWTGGAGGAGSGAALDMAEKLSGFQRTVKGALVG